MASITYNGPAIVLSGNAGYFSYSLASGEALQVVHTVGGVSTVFPLKSIADSESHQLNLSEILKALPLVISTPGEEYNEIKSNYLSTVTIRVIDTTTQDIEAYKSFNALRGYIKNRSTSASLALLILSARVLTQRPQIRKTYKESFEYLSVLVPWSSAHYTLIKTTVKVYKSNGTTETIYPLNNERAEGGIGIHTFRMDFNVVTNAIQAGGEIIAWDVTVQISEDSGPNSSTFPPIRFILQNGRAVGRCFAFVNDLAGVDTIHSIGKLTTLPEYDPIDFLNDGYREQQSINQDTIYEATSGPISTEEERQIWLSFLRSNKKWIHNGGQLIPITLKESSPEISAGEMNEVSFKFRMNHEFGAQPTSQSRTLPDFFIAAIRFAVNTTTGQLTVTRDSASQDPVFSLDVASGTISVTTETSYEGPVFQLDYNTGQLVMIE